MRSELDKLCEKKNVRAIVTFGNNVDTTNDEWQRTANPWTITLRYQRRQLTVPYFTGPAITEEPTAADVLSCLLLDASGYLNARDFEDWCGEYGYDTDSRKAERIYRQTERQTKKLRRFLGDDLDTFAQAEH